MTRPHGTFRQHCRISDLCPDFQATLHYLEEEGVSLHHPHERPSQVVIDERGNLLPRTDRHVAVILRVSRKTPLLPDMEEQLQGLAIKPIETIFLPMPGGDVVLRPHMLVLQEFSRLAQEIVEAGAPVIVVAVSHRRMIHEMLVIRHYPVALFDLSGSLLWAHPAAHSYGLIRRGFPSHQKIRVLGRRSPLATDKGPQRWDPESGLPFWYQEAKDHLLDLDPSAEPSFAEVLEHYADTLQQRYLAKDVEQAMQMATQEYLTGFERWFGSGGLYLSPGLLEFA